MNEEQLLQEARIEAEKVYPKNTPSHYSKSREENVKKQTIFIKGYIAKAKKQKSEAVDYAQQESEKAVREFKERLINDSDDYVEVFTLLRNVKYQTEREETQEYKMCFEMDLPKIIKGYLIEKLK